jgi:hypothetical protein
MHATIEEPISKQRIGKYTIIGVLLGTVFSIRSVQSGYIESVENRDSGRGCQGA